MYKDCFVVKARKSDGRRCGGGKPSSLSGGYGGERERFWRTDPGGGRHDLRRSPPAARHCQPVFWSVTSSRQPLDLAKDITIAYRTELKDTQQLQKCADRLAQSAQDFRLQLGEHGYRGNLRELLANPQIQRAFYCSMTLWNFVMTWRNCRWGVPPCWMRHLSAPRYIAHG